MVGLSLFVKNIWKNGTKERKTKQQEKEKSLVATSTKTKSGAVRKATYSRVATPSTPTSSNSCTTRRQPSQNVQRKRKIINNHDVWMQAFRYSCR